MTRYLIGIHQPDDYGPFREDEAMGLEIDALDDEMIAAMSAGQSHQQTPRERKSI